MMDLQTLTYIIVGATFALYIGIAIWARAGSTQEFYVAGGGVSPLANGMATAADWMSAASFISMAGLISFMGYDGSVYLMGWTGGYVLLALCLAPYLRKFGKFTVPDFIGDRYYSQTARTVAVICAILISFTYVAGQMRGVGVVFSRFLEVDITTGVIIGMAVVFFYAVLGGMKRYYLHPGCSVLCADFCLHGSCYLHLYHDHRSCITSNRFRCHPDGWLGYALTGSIRRAFGRTWLCCLYRRDQIHS